MKGALDRAEAEPDSDALDDSALWSHAAAVARTLEQLLVARPPGERLSQQALMQLHELAVGSGSELAAFDGESGRPAVVSRPDAVTHAVRRGGLVGLRARRRPRARARAVDRRRARGAPARRRRAPRARRAARPRGRGLAPADPRRARAGDARPLAARRHRGRRRRTRSSTSSRPASPTARSPRAPSRRSRCSRGRGGAPWKAATVEVAPATLMAQRPAWKVPPATLAPAATLSSTSLEAFLGCPFKWALRYQARLKPGEGVNLPEGNRLLGDFAHRVLQDMLCGAGEARLRDAPRAEDARAWARTGVRRARRARGGPARPARRRGRARPGAHARRRPPRRRSSSS